MTDPTAPATPAAPSTPLNLQPTLDLLASLPGQLADLKVAQASGLPALIAFALGLLALIAAAVQGTAPSSSAAFYAGLVLTVVGAIKSVMVTLANHAAQTAATTGASNATVAVANAVAQAHVANVTAVGNLNAAVVAADAHVAASANAAGQAPA